MKNESDDSKVEGDAGEIVPEDLKDPMSGYASADALESRRRVNEEGVDKAHPDEMQDAMSGYASADTLEPEQK